MLVEINDALVTALKAISVTELQVLAGRSGSPSTPTLDVFPANPAQEDSTFGNASALTLWTVRARVALTDDVSNQRILLRLMEPAGTTSVRAALLADQTLGGLVKGLGVDRPTGYEPDLNDVSCTWQVRVYTT